MNAPLLTAAEAWLARLVAMPTVSHTPLLHHLEAIAAPLRAAGAEVHVRTCGTPGFGNLIARFGPRRAGGILWAGHLDVVPATAEDWATDPFRLAVDGDRLTGRGTVDMKGFLASVLALAEARVPQLPQTLAITFDEETTMEGAAYLAQQCDALGIAPDLAIVGEPTALKPCTAHPGVIDLESRFIGRAGHGADRRDTASAIEAAARFICDFNSALPEGAQFNPGVISGGTARNVVAGESSLSWELRHEAGLNDPEALIAAIPNLPGVRREDTIVSRCPGLQPTQSSSAAAARLSAISGAPEGAMPFITEAGYYARAGWPVVVCGPGDWRRAHQANEYILREELAAGIDFAAALWTAGDTRDRNHP